MADRADVIRQDVVRTVSLVVGSRVRCRRSYRVFPERRTGSGGYSTDQTDSLRGGDCRYMRVELREGEGFDQLFRRFTKGIERSGVIREHRRGLRFISVQEENRAKRRKAERRRRRNATT